MKLKKPKYRRQIAYYTALKDPDPDKLTPHACAIVAAIQSYGGRPATRAELIVALSKRIRGSRQSPTRIISFHKKTLLAANFIRVTKKPAPLGMPAQKARRPAPRQFLPRRLRSPDTCIR